MGESFASGDTLWSLVRKILSWMSGINTSLSSISASSGGSGSAATFNSKTDVAVGVAGVAIQCPPQECNKVSLVAATDNDGSVYIGGSGVTNASGSQRGIELVPGGMLHLVPVSNTSMIYVNADNGGDKIGIVYM